jgi:hypothetical protein
MTIAVALLAILVPASVALVGYWVKRQSEDRLSQEHDRDVERLAQERERDERRLAQEHGEEQARLRLDAAMRAADLFGAVGDSPSNPASSASGLLALTQLGQADLAVALLVDLWSIEARRLPTSNGLPLAMPVPVGLRSSAREGDGPAAVSTETAVLVINAALEAEDSPNAQLVAAELLCRNATRLDPCQSLHWPAAIDGRWIPGLAAKAKLLVIEGLIDMTSHSSATENALRSLVVRLYGVWAGDPDNERVRGCVGTLIASLLPAVQQLTYTEFMQARETVTLEQLRVAAASAYANPDGFLERMVEKKCAVLRDWSLMCNSCDVRPGSLATAAH